MLRDGRLFDNEQVLPLLLWFSQWDKHCRYWAAQVMQQWLVFNPFLNYQMPTESLEGASDRLLRLLGKHPKGPYG